MPKIRARFIILIYLLMPSLDATTISMNFFYQSLCENIVPKEKENESNSAKVKNLLHLYVSKRDILYQFLQKNIHSSEDFGWRYTVKIFLNLCELI